MGEASVSQLAVYSPRPTIRINEQEFSRARELVIAMDMKEQEGGLSALELRLSNVASDPQGSAGYAFEDEEEMSLGATISIFSGDATEPQEIFRGIITGLEAEFPDRSPPELLILAEDRLQAARMTRRTQTYRDLSLSDLATTVASNLGITPVITAFTDTVGTWVQLNESDLAFLRRILRRYDGDVQIVGGELHVSPRKDVQRGTTELEMSSQLRSVKFIADLTDQVTEVTVSGWDALQGQRVSATSTGANPGPGNGRRGSQLLSETLGERTEHVGHIAVTTDDEAQALADTVFDQRARRFVTAFGTAEGNPALRVGTHVTLTGVSRRFENTYYVASVHHRFDVHEGYETDFTAECYTLGDR
jgi:phage protein D